VQDGAARQHAAGAPAVVHRGMQVAPDVEVRHRGIDRCGDRRFAEI
jgi:hypothetical protein